MSLKYFYLMFNDCNDVTLTNYQSNDSLHGCRARDFAYAWHRHDATATKRV